VDTLKPTILTTETVTQASTTIEASDVTDVITETDTTTTTTIVDIVQQTSVITDTATITTTTVVETSQPTIVIVETDTAYQTVTVTSPSKQKRALPSIKPGLLPRDSSPWHTYPSSQISSACSCFLAAKPTTTITTGTYTVTKSTTATQTITIDKTSTITKSPITVTATVTSSTAITNTITSPTTYTVTDVVVTVTTVISTSLITDTATEVLDDAATTTVTSPITDTATDIIGAAATTTETLPVTDTSTTVITAIATATVTSTPGCLLPRLDPGFCGYDDYAYNEYGDQEIFNIECDSRYSGVPDLGTSDAVSYFDCVNHCADTTDCSWCSFDCTKLVGNCAKYSSSGDEAMAPDSFVDSGLLVSQPYYY
jgi:hypothetical protein